jgi:exonuclease III
MAAHPTPPLPSSVISINVNGLRDARKRQHLFACLLDGPWQLILLQETHTANDEEVQQWMQEGAGPGRPWQGLGFWGHSGNQRSRGVAVLIHHRSRDSLGKGPGTPSVQYSATDGRAIRVEWGPVGQRVAAISAYAPSLPAERPAYFQQNGTLAAALQAGIGATAQLLVGGDFNCVMDQRDIIGPHTQGGGSRMVGSQELQDLMAAHGLIDAWRAIHPFTQEATHAATTNTSHARLDMLFMPATLIQQGWVNHCRHHLLFPVGDHAPVTLKLTNPGNPMEGPGVWHFPLALLQDTAFMGQLKASLRTLQQQWQPIIAAAQATPNMCKWEDIKAHIQLAATKYQKQQEQAARASKATQLRMLRAYARGQPVPMMGAAMAPPTAPAPPGPLPNIAIAPPPPAIAPLAGPPPPNVPPPAPPTFLAARQAAQQAQQATAAYQAEATTALWAHHGEQGTKWFHRLGKAPTPTIPLLAIKQQNGASVSLARDGKPVMDAAIVQHFVGPGGVFAPPPQPNQSDTNTMLNSLDRTVPNHLHQHALGPNGDGTITPACIQAAMSGLPPGKSPGSDGLPYEVYIALADILILPMVDAFNEAFQAGGAGNLAPSQRTGIVTLLHKGEGKPVDELSSFRPITLLNCDYKILARVLVHRLTPLADAVVDSTQTAFLPGRWIGDNILSHLEEIDYCRQEGQSGCILFLDFSQAYDRLSRQWLDQCMSKMGFPAIAIQWVNLLLRGTQVKAKYHGYCTPLMQVPTGLAQGSPLSPLLWVLASQPLSSRLRQLQQTAQIGAIPLPNGTPAPPCHQHADDTTLHTDTAESAAVAITQAVQPFAVASNSKLNLSKSHGMGLGPLSTMTGMHTGTGVEFTTQPLRHLGIMMGQDEEEAATQMYDKRRGAVYGAIRTWAPLALSAIGRQYVAKSVVASSLYYHATFVPMSAHHCKQICATIDKFIMVGALIEGESPPRGWAPGRMVEALPKEEGGLGRVDVHTQVTALQAKIAARLLHPQPFPWKDWMAHAFQRSHPTLGVKVMVSRKQPQARDLPGQPSLGQRRLAYWKALHQLQPFRFVPPTHLTAGHVRSESICYNARISSNGIDHLTSLPAHLPSSCTTVGALPAHLASDDVSVAAAAQRIFDALPVEWQEHAALGPMRQPVWEVSADGKVVRHARDATVPWCIVRQDKSLIYAPAHIQGAQPPGGWKPAALCFMPSKYVPAALLPTGGHLHGRLHGPDHQPFLLAPWAEAPLDPNVWAIGDDMPLSHLTVQAARRRLLHLSLVKTSKGEYVPGEGARPRSWGQAGVPTSGVMAWDQRRQAELQQHRQGVVRRGSPSNHTAGAASTSAAIYSAPWMQPSPTRTHPIQRAQATQAAAAATGSGQPARQRFDDSTDQAPLSKQRQPWKRVYKLMWQSGLEREAIHFAWRLMHQGLNIGSYRLPGMLRSGNAAGLADCLCAAASCAGPGAQVMQLGTVGFLVGTHTTDTGPLESHLHAFWECPMVQPAVKWLWDLWQKISGQPPPLNPAILIVGDPSLWSPPPALCLLWLRLRVTFLHTLWKLRLRRRLTNRPVTSPAIVAATAATLERAMRADFLCATEDLPKKSGLGQRWFRSRKQKLTLRDFEQLWCVRGVLANTVHGTTPSLSVHVPTQIPP